MPAVRHGAHCALVVQLDGHVPVPPPVHVPEEHVCPAPHARPHAPQWLALVWRLISHPLVSRVSQFAVPATHAIAHRPAVHVEVALGRVGHIIVVVVTPSALHTRTEVDDAQSIGAPAVHPATQLPAEHPCPLAHATGAS